MQQRGYPRKLRYRPEKYSWWLLAERAATSVAVYSIAEKAKTNDLDPYQYLKYLLERMPRANGWYSNEPLDSLIPVNAVLSKNQ